MIRKDTVKLLHLWLNLVNLDLVNKFQLAGIYLLNKAAAFCNNK